MVAAGTEESDWADYENFSYQPQKLGDSSHWKLQPHLASPRGGVLLQSTQSCNFLSLPFHE